MFLGLDLGTSGLKGVLMDEGGVMHGAATAACQVNTPHAGWSEQDPQDWVIAAHEVFKTLKADAPQALAQLKAISFSGHMHGAVCVQLCGKPTRHCILWNDMRSHVEAAELDADPVFRAKSGNIVFPGFTAPKLAWMKNNEPEAFAATAKVILPKDYLLYWMTGRFVTDCSDAAGSSWLDVGTREWSPELVAASGMRMDQMPDLVEGSEVVGTVQAELAEHLGISKDVLIVAGGADNAVSACGAGAVQAGQGFVSLGTSGVVLIASDAYTPDPASAVHTFCHAVPDRWYQMGVMLSATNSLNWLAGVLGKTPTELDAQAAGPLDGPSPLTFLPYLTGERTPHNDAAARGSFFGLSVESTAADMTRAVMEGVSFGLRDCLDALKGTGTDCDALLAMGGGTKSERWLETLATVLDTPLLVPEKGDYGAALGAARLAMIGAGASITDTLTPPPIERTIEPRADLRDAFDAAHEKYKSLYHVTKDLT